MKTRNKRILFLSLCGCIVIVIACVSSTFKARIYRAVPFGGSYASYDRLAGMLHLGMSTDEVRGILGTAKYQEYLDHGRRWSFSDDESTAGWRCVVDFSTDTGIPRLAYFLSIQHCAFTNSLFREFGTPVDGGEFTSDLFLKERRNQLAASAQRKKTPTK